MKKLLLAIPAIALGAFVVAAAENAHAVTRDPVADAVAVKPATGTPAFPIQTNTSTTPEVLACGTSPCAVTASSNVAILNLNAARKSGVLRNVGSADLFCCLGASCSTSSFQYLLTAAGRDALSFSGITIWGGAITCAGSTGGSLAVAAY